MDIKKPQLVKVEAFAIFLRNSSATPSMRDKVWYTWDVCVVADAYVR